MKATISIDGKVNLIIESNEVFKLEIVEPDKIQIDDFSIIFDGSISKIVLKEI